MKRVVFADTVFWVGLTRQDDQHHARVTRWRRWLDIHAVQIVTTEAVLWEWLNMASRTALREVAAQGYRHCHDSDQVDVVPFQPRFIQAAFTLYESRADKSTEALTTDHHFVQAKFEALLLREPPP